jgi:hypothetical protein
MAILKPPRFEKPSQVSPSKGWGLRIENLLVRTILEFLDEAGEGLGDLFSFGVTRWVEEYESDLIVLLDGLLDALSEATQDVPELHSLVQSMRRGESQAGSVLLSAAGSSAASGVVGSFLSPVLTLVTYFLNERIRPAVLPPNLAIPAAFRDSNAYGSMMGELTKLGFRDDQIIAMQELAHPLIPPVDLMRLSFRYPSESGDYLQELGRQGWLPERIEQLALASKVYPNVQDLIRFAVREVYTPDVAQRFQLYEEFPSEFGSESERLGLATEHAQQFWAAHWQLPSLNAAFEMYHRLRPDVTTDPFTLSDLQSLIKAQDFSGFWRDKLVAIAHPPITRVDLRRFYREGVYDLGELHSGYLDLGYDERLAQAQVDFTVSDALVSEKKLTVSVVENQYKRSAISHSVALEWLQGIGYPLEIANIRLDLIDLKEAEERIAEELEYIEFLFVNGEIDETEAAAQLGELGVAGSYYERKIRVWTIRRDKKISLPTASELEKYYLRDIVEFPDMVRELRKRNWADNRIDWYLQNLDQTAEEIAAKEAERAQKEQERLEAAELKTTYQQNRADLDVVIAIARLEAAQLKLARHLVIEESDLIFIAQRLEEIKVEIAQYVLDKATLRREVL